MTARGERGQVAVMLVGLLVLALPFGAGALALVRVVLQADRLAGTSDAVALAGARELARGYDELFPHDGLPPRLTPHELARRAQSAAASVARARGVELVSVRFEHARTEPGPTRLSVVVAEPRSAGRLLESVLAETVRRSSRAGIDFQPAVPDPGLFRVVDVAGFAGADAVIAAAEGQLGWPYVWGGESRAEGGFDCSGLIDFALAAAGHAVGRPTAAGLQVLADSIPLAAVQPGDLVFVGTPAEHVGLVVSAATVVEAPHRGAVVHLEAIAQGGWTAAGRLAFVGPGDGAGSALPGWVPREYADPLARAGRSNDVPPLLLAAQLEAESGFDPRAVSTAGAEGIAQFMPRTWRGAWNPWRAQSPFDPAAAIKAQARFLGMLLAQTRGDLPGALAAYNAGPGVLGGTWPPETRAYVATIMRRFSGGFAQSGDRGGLPIRLLAGGSTLPASTS